MQIRLLWRLWVNKRAAMVLGPALGACLVAYFSYYAIQGPRGLVVYSHLQQQVDRAETTLATLTAEREDLESHANRLRSKSLDLDMLEERARVVLNYTKPGELVIVSPLRGSE